MILTTNIADARFEDPPWDSLFDLWWSPEGAPLQEAEQLCYNTYQLMAKIEILSDHWAVVLFFKNYLREFE